MPNELRQFPRTKANTFCLIESDSRLIKAYFVDYSQMGCLLVVERRMSLKRQLALIYPNDKSEFIKMAGYAVHSFERNGRFYVGIQFMALLSR